MSAKAFQSSLFREILAFFAGNTFPMIGNIGIHENYVMTHIIDIT
jgi:hypothetical protein